MQPRLELGWKLVELTEKVSIRHPIDPQSITIYEDPFYSDAYIIALPLDSDPSYVWLTLFEQELWSSLDFWDRKVVVLGREIRLVTTRERVGDKLGWLEERVNAANRRVDEYNRKIKGEEQAKETGPKGEEAIRSELSSWLLRRVSR
jgi:hypothetical protein